MTSGERILATGARLSASLLWRLQRTFFERQGPEAWSAGTVPSYITSNPWIANAYAQVVLGWLRDCSGPTLRESVSFAPLDLRYPVHIVELGCGSGRFGYLFLSRLLDLLARSPLRPVPIRYVLTDFTASNLNALRRHPTLQPFVQEGVLDFACFDAETDAQIHSLSSGEVLDCRTLRNPLVVIANYVFDGIPQDAFAVRGGCLFEALPTITAPPDAAEPDDPALLAQVHMDWQEQPAADEPYGDADLDGILREYTQRLDNVSFLFPSAGLRCVRNLARLSDGRLLLLSADKGHCREGMLADSLGLAVHGSFSMMVNYHALGRWFERQGGAFLTTSHLHTSLTIVALLLGTPPAGTLETRLAFNEAIDRLGPDDFFDLKTSLEIPPEGMSPELLLARIRLTGWDASLFFSSFGDLVHCAGTASELLRHEIYRMVHEVWKAHFPIREERDLAFHLGVLLCEIQCYEAALIFFQESTAAYGPNPATAFNIALCRFHLGDLEAARTFVDQALEGAPDYAPAAALREEIATAIASDGGGALR
jgi:hypothetical protein